MLQHCRPVRDNRGTGARCYTPRRNLGLNKTGTWKMDWHAPTPKTGTRPLLMAAGARLRRPALSRPQGRFPNMLKGPTVGFVQSASPIRLLGTILGALVDFGDQITKIYHQGARAVQHTLQQPCGRHHTLQQPCGRHHTLQHRDEMRRDRIWRRSKNTLLNSERRRSPKFTRAPKSTRAHELTEFTMIHHSEQ